MDQSGFDDLCVERSAELKRALARATADTERYASTVDDLEQKISWLSERNSALTDLTAELYAEVEEAISPKTHREQLDTLKATCTREAAALRTTIAELEHELEQRARNIDRERARAEHAVAQATDAATWAAVLERDANDRQEEYDALEASRDALAARAAQLHDALDVSRDTAADTKAALAQAIAADRARQSDIARLEAGSKAHAETLRDMHDSLDLKSEELARLHSAAARQRADLEASEALIDHYINVAERDARLRASYR